MEEEYLEDQTHEEQEEIEPGGPERGTEQEQGEYGEYGDETKGNPDNEVPTQESRVDAVADRIRAETQTTLQKQYDEQISGLGIPNPYTGKPFVSFEEFRNYGEQFKREQLEAEAKRKGKSVAELEEEAENRSYLSRKRQEEKNQREALDALETKKAFVKADLSAFVKKFPAVDPAKLEQNPKFRKFAGKRLYQEPLSELYEDFVDLVSDTERAAVEKTASKAARSTGGGQGGGTELLTASQRAELEEWNRDNPGMKMTAKEFLGR